MGGLILGMPGAVAQMPPAQVRVAPLTQRDLPASIRLVGTVRAWRTAVVAAEVGGLVGEFNADEGDFLQQGEVICQIDASLMEMRLAEALARLGSLRAELTERENGTRAEVLDQLKAAVGEAQAMHDLWKFERQRVTELYERKQSSAKEKHDAEMEFLAAERRLAQARAQHEAAVNGPRIEEIERYRHEVAAQQQIVRQLERDVAKSQVRAPFTGFVVAKRSEVGEWLEAGGAVVEMVDIERVKVRADAPEQAIAFAAAGTPATVEIEALGASRAAPVARVIPRAAESARTFPVEIDLDNADHRLLPGMFVWAHVPSGPQAHRLMAPKDAVVPRGPQKHIFVIRPGQGGAQVAMPVSVTTGLEVAGEIEVRADGLAPGDLVVVRGNERLLPFMPSPVVPLPVDGAPPAPPAPAAQAPASQPAGEEIGEAGAARGECGMQHAECRNASVDRARFCILHSCFCLRAEQGARPCV